MDFPPEEVRSLSGRPRLVTHRVSDDFYRYDVGDKVMTPWGTLYEITGREVVGDVSDSPYFGSLTDGQRKFLKEFGLIAVLTLEQAYDPPYGADEVRARYGEEVFRRLYGDPCHRWRMETGVELVHREPTEEEFRRIVRNWRLMPDKLKEKSDAKSVELFGMGNMAHAEQLEHYYSARR